MGVLKGVVTGTILLMAAVPLTSCTGTVRPSFQEISLVSKRVPADPPTAEDRFRVLRRSEWATRQAGAGIELPSDLSGGCGCAEVSGTSFWGGLGEGPVLDVPGSSLAILSVRVKVPRPVTP